VVRHDVCVCVCTRAERCESISRRGCLTCLVRKMLALALLGCCEAQAPVRAPLSGRRRRRLRQQRRRVQQRNVIIYCTGLTHIDMLMHNDTHARTHALAARLLTVGNVSD
jgi:hypothetical protein